MYAQCLSYKMVFCSHLNRTYIKNLGFAKKLQCSEMDMLCTLILLLCSAPVTGLRTTSTTTFVKLL